MPAWLTTDLHGEANHRQHLQQRQGDEQPTTRSADARTPKTDE
ncbi:hypothetical protein OH768_13605 [Streptomyces sp. NBC_01622]|nr:hypothetical protein OH768_13605 [Streptomyces sp. NBC_01622]